VAPAGQELTEQSNRQGVGVDRLLALPSARNVRSRDTGIRSMLTLRTRSFA
jgi:hypothetical protein